MLNRNYKKKFVRYKYLRLIFKFQKYNKFKIVGDSSYIYNDLFMHCLIGLFIKKGRRYSNENLVFLAIQKIKHVLTLKPIYVYIFKIYGERKGPAYWYLRRLYKYLSKYKGNWRFFEHYYSLPYLQINLLLQMPHWNQRRKNSRYISLIRKKLGITGRKNFKVIRGMENVLRSLNYKINVLKERKKKKLKVEKKVVTQYLKALKKQKKCIRTKMKNYLSKVFEKFPFNSLFFSYFYFKKSNILFQDWLFFLRKKKKINQNLWDFYKFSFRKKG